MARAKKRNSWMIAWYFLMACFLTGTIFSQLTIRQVQNQTEDKDLRIQKLYVRIDNLVDEKYDLMERAASETVYKDIDTIYIRNIPWRLPITKIKINYIDPGCDNRDSIIIDNIRR